MPLFPLLLQSTDKKTPPARAAVVAVAFVVISSFFVSDASSTIFARIVAGI
jgi:NhaP-type Na+/H+ or K+/H+ antiporter